MSHALEIAILQQQLATCTIAAKETAIMRKIRELMEEDEKAGQSAQNS